MNPTFQHFLFGIYALEVYKFFKDKFDEFSLKDKSGNPVQIRTQVFYGTPRAAFRKFQTTNGKVMLPMINFYIVDYERLPQFEPVDVKVPLRDTLNPATGTMQMSKAPGVFSLNINVNVFAPGRKEMDYLLHAIYNSFPKGEISLIHRPDPVNHPESFLLMPFLMESNVSDDTEIEGLDPKETLDIYKTTFSLKCTRAFVPYDNFEVPVVTAIDFDFMLQDMILKSTTQYDYSNFLGSYILPNSIETTVPTITTIIA